MPIPPAAAERPGYSLRAHLTALVLAILLPALALGATTAWRMAGKYRAAFEERLSDTAEALALAIDQEVQAHVAALAALAASPRLDDPDLTGFHTLASGAAAALGTPVALIGADLRQLLRTDRPFGAPLPATAAAETVRLAVETGLPAVSDLLVGAVLRTPVIAVMVPIVHGGRVDGVLSAPVDPGRLAGRLAAYGLAEGAFATLTDRSHAVVARSRDAAAFLGRPAPDWFPAAIAGKEADLLKGRALAGHDVILAFRRLSNAPGWTMVVAEPLAAYDASWRSPLAGFVAGAAATFLVALLAAAWLGRRILRPVRSLARQAEAVAASSEAGAVPTDVPAPVAEFESLRVSVRRADAAIRARAAEAAAGEVRLRAVVDNAMDAILVFDAVGTVRSFNRAAESIFGYGAAEAIGCDVSMLAGVGHHAQRDGCPAAFLRSGGRGSVGAGREIEGRRKDGSSVPLELSVGEWRDGDGKRFFTGIMRDISARKAGEARRALLMREVDHRANNALAVVQSVVRLTKADEPRAFAAAVQARVAALARAHSLLAERGWSGADLRAVAERELAAYASPCTETGQRAAVSLDGPPLPLAPTAVQPVAMVLHELATNAAKHGALCVPEGRVEVRWQATGRAEADGRMRLRWTETGGPPVTGVPAHRGFGSRVVEATVHGQLGGKVERRWEPTGLVVEVVVPLARAAPECGAAGSIAAASAA